MEISAQKWPKKEICDEGYDEALSAKVLLFGG